ncbi:MAG: NUDIX hydrolase [Proteobacteria bacterium]|nr:NUDIX hydrolase [Pseudomonadota bacterium]
MTSVPPAKIISRKLEFRGWHALETIVIQPKSLKHDGLCEPMSREIYYCRTCVVVLLYLPETDQILLNQQFRLGAFIAGDNSPWLMECCAGLIDAEEEAEEAVHREAMEETGCEILDLEYIGKAYPSPGGSNECFQMYCGRIGKAEAGHFGLETEGEEIKTHLVPAIEAIRMLDNGQITNAGAVMCLHWFARHHDRLRQKWSVR